MNFHSVVCSSGVVVVLINSRGAVRLITQKKSFFFQKKENDSLSKLSYLVDLAMHGT